MGGVGVGGKGIELSVDQSLCCVSQPLLVETKKAKRFNSPLRGLHELCSWGAKEGLRKLRCIHEVSCSSLLGE